MAKKLYVVMGILTILVLSMSLVSAYKGSRENCDEERHELMTEAFSNLDYDVWSELMTNTGRNSRVMQMVNEDNFDVFVELHNAKISGNAELESQLRSELGLNRSPKDGSGWRENGEKPRMNKNRSETGKHQGKGLRLHN
jgi:hypothetical protein